MDHLSQMVRAGHGDKHEPTGDEYRPGHRRVYAGKTTGVSDPFLVNTCLVRERRVIPTPVVQATVDNTNIDQVRAHSVVCWEEDGHGCMQPICRFRLKPMAIGEIFLTAFLKVLFDRLMSREVMHFARQHGIRSKLEKWRKTFLIYSEDVLDEFTTEVLARKLMGGHHAITGKVENLIPNCLVNLSPSAVKYNVGMKYKIKSITCRLEEICKQRVDLGLQIIAGMSSATAWQRPPSTSLVGMGGIGKTTLARLVYNDKEVEGFNPKAWVCVSEDFDVLKITKAILESVTSSPSNLKDLNQVQIQLEKAIAGQKFLIVLDNVWSKNYGLWKTLKSPFMAGTPGSKIIVTTRSVDVALTLGPIDYYNLELLSDDDCWSIFEKHAFENRDASAHQNLELIHAKVVEKCKGLPQAAANLGGLLCCKQRDDEWQGILKSRIWDLSEESDILPVLRLSYHHLPSHLKRCFSYSAIFPKGYEFEEMELILLWMADGLIQQSEDNKQMEDLGHKYFRDLLSRSIFQKSCNNSSKFLMHDLVNDLAQWVSGETNFRLEDELKANKQPERFRRARHSSYVCGYSDDFHKYEIFPEVECLRTFLRMLKGDHTCARFISNMFLSDLLPKFKKLRVLSLKSYHIIELPNSIGRLMHLRYLDMSNTAISSLPESTCSLINLQTLLLRRCFYLMKWPSKVMNLINLRHLDITDVHLIKEMPLGMEEWKCLQTLSNFIVSEGLENATDLQDPTKAILSDKNDLECLVLECRYPFRAYSQSVLGMLKSHTSLKELTIKCYGGTRFPSWVGDPSFSNIVMITLESCTNCRSLPSLGLLCSLKALTIREMTELKIIGSEIYGDGCSKPFQSLETLCFRDLQEWELWDPIGKNEYVESFPLLRELSIVKCPKLSGRLPDHLPSLKKLVISECAQFEVSFASLPVLSDLSIDGCKGLVCGCNSLKFVVKGQLLLPLKKLQIRKCEKLKHLLDDRGHINSTSTSIIKYLYVSYDGFPTSLTTLTIEDFNLYKPLIEWGLHKLTALRNLSIGGCLDAVSFPQEELGMMLPTSLTKLAIAKFPELKHLSSKGFRNLTSLDLLRIRNCPKLTSFPEVGLPSSLLQLYIDGCPLLKKQSKRDKGLEWTKIAHIPCVKIDDKFIYNEHEEG
ncbi:hypothetical protein KPL71_001632 [Citrus sinensis]|uniref:Uncharacterized protein n=1 Tax=Citrus sinensis TaxID=2711 RepID=A0ACB8NZX0_CITSI|nr:hypothetical protein KPL71_001632 [Citrus sinensis]